MNKTGPAIDPVVPEEAIPSSRIGKGRVDISIWFWRIGLIITLLVIWEFSAGRLFNEFWSSRPSLIGQRLLALFVSGEAWRHLGATVSEALLGLLLGAA